VGHEQLAHFTSELTEHGFLTVFPAGQEQITQTLFCVDWGVHPYHSTCVELHAGAQSEHSVSELSLHGLLMYFPFGHVEHGFGMMLKVLGVIDPLP
jgi:hypothetical protein